MSTLIFAALLAAAGQSGSPLPSPEVAAAELQGGNYSAAERDYHRIVVAYPQMAEAYANLGICYFLEKKYQQAILTFQRGLKMKPDMASAWLFLGISRFDLNEPAETVAPLRRYVGMNGEDPQGHYYLGISLLSLEKFQDAAQELSEARRLDPKNTDTLYHLAECYLHLARQKGADVRILRENYDGTVSEIAAIDPASVRLHQLQAGAYEADGDSDKAIHELEEAVKSRPRVQGLYYTLGCYYLKQFRYDEALAQFNAELGLDSPTPRTYLQIGHTYISRHEPEKALDPLKKAIQAEPASPTPWVELGRAYTMTGQYELSLSALGHAVRLGDTSSATYFTLSQTYRKMGKLDLARQAALKSEEASREQSNKAIEKVGEVARGKEQDKE